MTLQIVLSSEAERELRERAAAAGQDPSAFVEQLVEAELAADPGWASKGAAPEPRLSADLRIAELDAWASMNPALPYEADDSREAIYEGRGE